MATERNKPQKTIEATVKAHLCTGCGSCFVVCPHDAIRIGKNASKGLYLPQINEDVCVQCGLCYEICSGHTVDFESWNQQLFAGTPSNTMLGSYLECYRGYATDTDIRRNSASGGLLTQLLIYALEKGVIHGALTTRMGEADPFEPWSSLARTRAEIIQAAQSKYCPVAANVVLRDILREPAGQRFAFVGLPCHVHGMRNLQRALPELKEKVNLCISIFCAKTLSFLATEYLMKRLRIERNTVAAIHYRGNGWPGGMTVSVKKGSGTFIPLHEYYDEKFSSFSPFRCTLCSDHSGELADLSFGDAWMPELKSDPLGHSIAVVRERGALRLLQEMAACGKAGLERIDDRQVARSQGEFRYKKRQISARLRLVKLLGMQTPVYTQKLLSPKPLDFVMSVRMYFWLFVASRRSLWPMLAIRTISARSRRFLRRAFSTCFPRGAKPREGKES